MNKETFVNKQIIDRPNSIEPKLNDKQLGYIFIG